jgi:hypothetical protein
MGTHRFTTNVIAGAMLGLAFAATARAQNSDSFVATTGSDANSCLVSAPCRTFARALAVTNPGGEVIVTNSGEFGPASITQPVAITAIGVDASISVTSGNAVTIETNGSVTLTGLKLHGHSSGANGIVAAQVGFLRLYDVQVENFTNDGIVFVASGGNLSVYDSKFNDCGHDGLVLQASHSRAYVHNSAFDNNGFAGADNAEGLMTVVDSSAHYNVTGFYANGGRLELDGDRSIFNIAGIEAAYGGALFFAHCLIADNLASYYIGDETSTISGSNPGTNLISPGQASFGTLSAPQPLY